VSKAFTYRLTTAEKFQTELFDALLSMGFAVALNGTEHTHPDFVAKLRASTDQTSLAIRFQPDGVACIGGIPRTVYIEAKHAVSIERTAYEQYVKLSAAGNILAVVFGKLDWQWNFIECIGLIRGEETVNSYSVANRFPVEDGWIVPRAAQHWRTVKIGNPGASGTPYREIAIGSLLAWEQFKPAVIERLSSRSIVED